MSENQKMVQWNVPTKDNNTNLVPEEVWDFVDFLSSQEFVPEPSSPSLAPCHINDFKERQKEELEKFLQQQKEAEQAFLLQKQKEEEEEARRRKRQEEEEAEVEKHDPGQKERSKMEIGTVLLEILTELKSLKQMYQASLLKPKRKRPSRAKQPISSENTSTVPPLVISTGVGSGLGKGLRHLKQMTSRT